MKNQCDPHYERCAKLSAINAALVEALESARRAMIVSVTGVSDNITIYDTKRWIEQADAALKLARGE